MISEIWIDEEGRLMVRVADGSRDLSQIYRASASGVHWDARSRALCSPVPKEWSYAQWFVKIVEDARSEYGLDLLLAESTTWHGMSTATRASIEQARAKMPPHEPRRLDERSLARAAGDERRRQEAKELFDAKQWQAAVTKLESLEYPHLMDRLDRKRLEIARKRA